MNISYFILCFYRALKNGLGIADSTVEAPALFIMGKKDYVYEFPGMKEYINSEMLKQYFVPDLEIVFLPEGTHFVHEQSPDQVNELILSFVRKHIWSLMPVWFPGEIVHCESVKFSVWIHQGPLIHLLHLLWNVVRFKRVNKGNPCIVNFLLNLFPVLICLRIICKNKNEQLIVSFRTLNN